MADKKLIRSSIRKLRDSLPEDERSVKSAGITDNVTGTPEYKAARDVLVYVSTGSEADTTELIKRCFEDKKNVYVPKVYGKDMRFIGISSLVELEPGYYGIMEPVSDEPVWEKGSMDTYNDTLCIMPGLAFDREFNRIGYGGGFYDKFLEKAQVYKMAVCYDCQIVECIDAQDTDIKPDMIVTDMEVIKNGQH